MLPRNPIEKKRQRLKVLLNLIFFLVPLIILILGFSYILFFSPIFKVHQVNIYGEKFLNKKTISKYFQNLNRKNIFLININIKQIQNKFPLVKSVNISRIYPNTININISEYPPYALFQSSSKTYVASYNGVILDTMANSSNKYTLPLVVINTNKISEVPINEITPFVSSLEGDKKYFLTELQFDPPYDLYAIYSDGHKIIISIHNSLNNQMNQIQSVEKYLGFSKCKTLDVRFDNVYCSQS